MYNEHLSRARGIGRAEMVYNLTKLKYKISLTTWTPTEIDVVDLEINENTDDGDGFTRIMRSIEIRLW